MTVDEVILWLMGIFMAAGAIDRILGSPLGLGKEFEEGLLAMGTLALSMLGILALAPVLAEVLAPVVVPVFRFLGADPAMFAGSILANDMGGAPLAYELAESKEAAQFGGLIIGSMLGATVVFTVPIALGIIGEEDRSFFARGILAGVITIPVGALAGGLAAGFPVGMVLRNLLPIVLFAGGIVLGLWFFEKAVVTGFLWFGRIIVGLITLGLGAGIFRHLTGVTLIPGMAPIMDGVPVVAGISFVLAGAFPLVWALTKVLRRPLMKLGGLIGINDTAAAGMVASLANSIPMFSMIKDMDRRGKVVNVAFAVSAAFVFGDHLGFTAGYEPKMLVPVILAKLTAGITAVPVAMLLTRKATD